MTVKEFTLLTKAEAERLCERTYTKTKIVPILVKEDRGYTKYYMVYVQLVNNRWMPMMGIKPEYVKPLPYQLNK